jgi:hypothetical protein
MVCPLLSGDRQARRDARAGRCARIARARRSNTSCKMECYSTFAPEATPDSGLGDPRKVTLGPRERCGHDDV